MPLFKRKPRITDDMYGKLMMSFGRAADSDPFVAEPAAALAERVVGEFPAEVVALDASKAFGYAGATLYHLRLLAGSWIMCAEGSVPRATAEVFEEALAWKFGPLLKGSEALPRRLSALARGEMERDLRAE